MRHKGCITRWKDEKGYGFVTPDEGGEPLFLHVRSFTHAGRRPTAGEDVTYEVGTDEKGRSRAMAVAYTDDKGRKIRPATVFCSMLAVGFLLLVCAVVQTGRLPAWLLWCYLAVSAISFIAYGLDKRAALKEQQRTPENTLHLLALTGGWPGALLAQRVFRHKSSKLSFQGVFWATVLLNGGAFWMLCFSTQLRWLRNLLQ